MVFPPRTLPLETFTAKALSSTSMEKSCSNSYQKVQAKTFLLKQCKNIWKCFFRNDFTQLCTFEIRELRTAISLHCCKTSNKGYKWNYSGSHWASVFWYIDLSKHLVKPGLYFLSIPNGWPCMRGSFWHKDSLITHILFELQPIMIFSPVANFGHHPLLHMNVWCKISILGLVFNLHK